MKQEVKTLYLVRHAKAEKQWAGLSDIDRPLHPEGFQEAHIIANELRMENEIPQLMITSPAQRAVGTALIFQRILKVPLTEFRLKDILYEIETRDLRELVSGLEDSYQSVMIFGHNPSFTNFTSEMDHQIQHMPTGSVVRFDFEVMNWKHCSYINAIRKLFLYP